MATIATAKPRPLVSKFYVTMAAIFAAIAFGGFFGTYWLQVARGTACDRLRQVLEAKHD